MSQRTEMAEDTTGHYRAQRRPADVLRDPPRHSRGRDRGHCRVHPGRGKILIFGNGAAPRKPSISPPSSSTDFSRGPSRPSGHRPDADTSALTAIARPGI